MAIVVNKFYDQLIDLNSTHTFGRSKNVCTNIEERDVSRMQAVITWNGQKWQLKDTSTNGTYVNKRRIALNKPHTLKTGDIIQFGTLDAHTWKILDTSPPITKLVPLNSQNKAIKLIGPTSLPTDKSPEVFLYSIESGAWFCDSNSGSWELQSGDIVQTKQQSWQFFDGKAEVRTEEISNVNLPPPNVRCRFRVSRNEEHVTLSIEVDNKTYHLEERSHHYLMLLLARQLLADLPKMDSTNAGWLSREILTKMMGANEYYINTQIHRLRKQITDLLPRNSSFINLIERRRGEIRFAHKHITIEGGHTLPDTTPDHLN